MNYLVYENGNCEASFWSLTMAMSFAEEWGRADDAHMDIVNGATGEVLDTWANGTWEKGN